jgi:hypothetical protein
MTEEELTEGHLKALGKALKKAYIIEKNQRIGGKRPYKFSEKHDRTEHWRKIAMQCLELNADPITYMRAAFIKCTMPDGPFVNSLGGPAAKHWYVSYIRSIASHGAMDKKDNENVVDAVERNELSAQLIETRKTIERLFGTWELNEKSVEWLLRYSNPVQVHLRVLLCYPVEEVKVRYGPEAYAYFAERPQLINAAKKLGFPIDDMLLWLSQPVRHHP